MAPIDRGVCSAFGSLRAAECALCRYFIMATGLKGEAVGMLMQQAKPAWIAFGGRSFQFHKRLPELLVIARSVSHGMLVSRRDFRTRISASIDSEGMPPESSAGRGKRLLMQHLLAEDVQLHSSCTTQRLLLIRQATSTINSLYGCQKNSFQTLRICN